MTTDTAPNPLAVHSIDEFVFSAPDLDEAAHFYRSFGLEVRSEGDALSLYTYGHPHRWARIFQAARKRILWLTLGIHPGDTPWFERHIAERGIARIEAPRGAPTDGIWIEGPDGLPLQLRVAAKSSPSRPAPREFPAECHNRGRSPSRSATQTVHPLYLSHILLFSADVDAAQHFYREVLGLRLSDQSASEIVFLHSPHGSDHHLIALAKSAGLGLHHSSWCVSSFDAVGLGMQQMTEAGYKDGWGVGRHVLGSNYFRYVRDPWGSYAEYSFDIDYVEAGKEWPAADHASQDSLYAWGPSLPPDFIVNHELPGA